MILYTIAQAPLSVRFSRKEYWNELTCPLPWDLPNAGIEPCISSVSCIGRQANVKQALVGHDDVILGRLDPQNPDLEVPWQDLQRGWKITRRDTHLCRPSGDGTSTDQTTRDLELFTSSQPDNGLKKTVPSIFARKSSNGHDSL